MILHSPFIITPRLLAGVKVGNAFISISDAGVTGEGRTRYQYHIDGEGFEHTGKDLKSGVGGGSLVEGMTSLLSFLGAAAESFQSGGENCDLFPPRVSEWAYQNSDELAMLQCEIEESETEID